MAALRESKAKRIYARHFAHVPVFQARSGGPGGGFSPLPWVLRRWQWNFSPREFQVYCYLIMRSGQEGISWLSDRQIANDLNVGFRKIAPHVRSLLDKGFIAVADVDGARCICIADPLHAIGQQIARGGVPQQHIDALNDDLAVMGLPPIVGPATESMKLESETA